MPRYGRPYWEAEEPREARAGTVLLRWFPSAGKLQVHRMFVNAAGEERTGGIVTLDADALAVSPEATALLRAVLGAVAVVAGEVLA